MDRKRMKVVHWLMAATSMSGLYSYTYQLHLKSLEIGYDVPGLRDSIRHGETGITIMKKTLRSDDRAGNFVA
jgi:hypothetical protein